MRAPGPPVRFLIGVIALWVGGRAAVLTWGGERAAEVASLPPVPPRPSPVMTASPAGPSPLRRQGPMSVAANGVSGGQRDRPLPAQGRRVRVEKTGPKSSDPIMLTDPALPSIAARGSYSPDSADAAGSAPPALAPEPPASLAAAAAAPSSASRWSGAAFLFARAGGDAVSLAGGGQLGASQAGARVAYRLDGAGRLAAAARVYVPVAGSRGAEAAMGIDLRPLPGAPLRLSVERRVAIGRDGRDAWSAYAAGGFFRGLGRSLELDGYGQAGVVGLRSRDPFADGALRIARRIDLAGGGALLAGAGAWGAAQPGAARLDLGPRVALRLPVAGTAVSIAGEWRARVAGEARPRSGPALTIAADF